MSAAVRAGIAYFAAAFAAGFALGTVRVLLVEPVFGELPAILAETPLMLAVSFVLARWLGPAQEQVFGAIQANAVSALLHRQRQILGGFAVGPQADVDAIAGAGRFAAQAPQPAIWRIGGS